MSNNNNLIIYRKVEALLDLVYPRLINFPKYEKFALSQFIRTNIFHILEYLSLANNVKSLRVKHLQTADAYLQLVKTQIKFAKRRKYISKGFYSTIDESMTEIGKMMTGYIKASSKR